jgi:hypothetical protein
MSDTTSALGTDLLVMLTFGVRDTLNRLLSQQLSPTVWSAMLQSHACVYLHDTDCNRVASGTAENLENNR